MKVFIVRPRVVVDQSADQFFPTFYSTNSSLNLQLHIPTYSYNKHYAIHSNLNFPSSAKNINIDEF